MQDGTLKKYLALCAELSGSSGIFNDGFHRGLLDSGGSGGSDGFLVASVLPVDAWRENRNLVDN